jgi:integrase
MPARATEYAQLTHGAVGITHGMASVTRYKDGWRAHIFKGGVRASKVFRTRGEAHAWASEQEQAIATGTAPAFATVAARFLALKLPQLDSDANRRTYEQSITDHVLPHIGPRPVNELKRRDLVAVVRALADKGKVETAHRVGQRICAILDHAVDSGEIESHPAAGLSRVLPVKQRRAMPAITPADLPQLLTAIQGYGEPVTRIGLLLLAHTFVRTSELVGARWDELRDDVWVVPAERMKRRIPHVVPITPQVRALLDELAPITGESPYWLASPFNPRVSISNNTLLFALYRLGYRGRMTGHGFRAVASSILNESGLWSRDAVEKQLAHREVDAVRAAYMRAAFLPERIKMMAWYSERLSIPSAFSG